MKSSVFMRTMENIRKHINIRPVATDRKRNRLATEPNYDQTKWYPEKLLAVGMNKKEVKMNKMVHFRLSSNILI